MNLFKSSFNAGLLSPLLDGRTDTEKYAQGCRKLRNMVPRTYGAAFKRPGTLYLGTTEDNEAARLIGFNYSVSTRFMLEFGDLQLRIWNAAGELVTPDITDPGAWSGTTASYTQGAVTSRVGGVYVANSTHVPSGGNQPPSASWNTIGLKRWATATAYTQGQLVTDGEFQYVVKLNHTSGSAPSADTTNYKRMISPSLVLGGSYAVGDHVRYSGFVYRCIQAHVDSAGSRPGGTYWTSYWEDATYQRTHSTASKAYKAGDVVDVSGTLYVCFQDNTSSAANAPGGGSSVWTAISGVTPWITTGSWASMNESWSVADVCMEGIHLYVCTASVTITGSFQSMDPTASGSIRSQFARITADRTGTGSTNYSPAWTASPTYSQGVMVTSGGSVYVCLQDHTTASTTQPETSGGSAYWQRLNNLFDWATSTAYTVGQWVIEGGSTYRCLAAHTSGTFTADLAASKWVAASYVLNLVTPWGAAKIADVQALQINDQVWLLHPEYAPRILERYADNIWRLAEVPWTFPPMRDDNITENLTLSASATSGTGITLTASGAVFQPGHVGAYFAIRHRRETSTAKIDLNGTSAVTGSALRVLGKWEIFIYGTGWTGNVVLEQSADGSTNWTALRNWEMPTAGARTITASGTAAEETYLRLRKLSGGTGTGNNYAQLELVDSQVTGLVKVTAVTTSSTATADVVIPLQSAAATWTWAEGAFSDYRGWPRSATLHELRLWLAGNSAQPQTLFASVVDDFFTFRTGTNDDDGLSFTLASNESNAIQWIQSLASGLAIGTNGEEWMMDGSGDGGIITPTSVRTKLQSRYGSARLPAVLAGEAALFWQRDRRRLREFTYSFEADKFVSPDLTLLAEHVTESGIKEAIIIRQPDVALYAVTNDGRLLVMTYEREQNVVAWSEHDTDGTFESVSGIYGGETEADQVWLVVNRTVDGSTVRYVERFDPVTAKWDFDTAPDQLVYLDSAKITTPGGTSVTGLDHLEGEEVYALADGVPVGPFTVSSGAITLANSAATAVVGLRFTATLQGVKLESQLDSGSMQGKKQRCHEVTIRLHDSNGGEVIGDDDAEENLTWRVFGPVDDIDNRVTKPTDFQADIEAAHTHEVDLTLRSRVPMPFNVLSIAYHLRAYGD